MHHPSFFYSLTGVYFSYIGRPPYRQGREMFYDRPIRVGERWIQRGYTYCACRDQWKYEYWIYSFSLLSKKGSTRRFMMGL